MATATKTIEITRDDKDFVKDVLAEYAPGLMPLFGSLVTGQWLDVEDFVVESEDEDGETIETVVSALSQQQDFGRKIAVIFNAVSKLRAEYDKQVWEGHRTGDVHDEILSVRAERTGDAPGRKPTVKDETDKLMGF